MCGICLSFKKEMQLLKIVDSILSLNLIYLFITVFKGKPNTYWKNPTCLRNLLDSHIFIRI